MKTTFVVYVAKIIGFQKQDVATPQARRTALIQGALESSDPGASENFKADKIGSKWSRFDLSLTMEAARISAFQRTSNHRRATQLKAFDPLFRKLNGAKTVHKTPSVRMVPNFSLKNGFFFNPFHLNFPDFFACGARPAGAKPPPLFCFLNKLAAWRASPPTARSLSTISSLFFLFLEFRRVLSGLVPITK